MRYQKIHSQIWQDEKFSGLSLNAQLLFLYILTSPHSNALGVYVLPLGYIEGDLKWPKKTLSKAFGELLKMGSIKYNSPVILIKNHLRYNPIDSLNKNQLKNIVKIISQLPRNPLVLELEPLVKPFLNGLPNPFETLSNSETEEETEEEKETLPKETLSEELSFFLLKKIRERKPDFKTPNLKNWATEVKRMLNGDGRSEERIKAVIEWSQGDPFWKNNILSTAKLREQFDQLELRMEKSNASAYGVQD